MYYCAVSVFCVWVCVFAVEIGCDRRALCGFFPSPDVAQSDMPLCADGNVSPRETRVHTHKHTSTYSAP